MEARCVFSALGVIYDLKAHQNAGCCSGLISRKGTETFQKLIVGAGLASCSGLISRQGTETLKVQTTLLSDLLLQRPNFSDAKNIIPKEQGLTPPDVVFSPSLGYTVNIGQQQV